MRHLAMQTPRVLFWIVLLGVLFASTTEGGFTLHDAIVERVAGGCR